MYYQHFQLEQPPFRITPDTRLFYSGAKRGAVLDALVYAILNGEGIIKVVGEVGSGKTMLCRMLEVRLPRHVEIVYIANPSLSPDNILQVVAHELKVISDPDCTKLRAMQLLQDYLTRQHAEGRHVVVFIEEAQGMPLATLEEIRLLSNLETNHDKLMQLVLFGQPELDENLAVREIRQLRERITHSFNLEPLETEEVREYLAFRLWISGYRGGELFDKRVSSMIAQRASGLIRRINILADKTLLAAYADNAAMVTPRHVRSAVADCEFSGAPMALPRWRPVAAGLALGVIAGGLTYAGMNWHGDVPVGSRVAEVAPSSVEQTYEIPVAVGGMANDLRHSPLLNGESLEDWLGRSRRVLQEEGESGFSIQLLTVERDRNSAERLADFIAGLPSNVDLGKIYIYETEVERRPVFAVLYNRYPNIQMANAAIDVLPEPLRRWQPFVRTVKKIRKELAG